MKEPFHTKSLKSDIGAPFAKLPSQKWMLITPSNRIFRSLDIIRVCITVHIYDDPELRMNHMLDKTRYSS